MESLCTIDLEMYTKNVCTAKEAINKMKREPTDGRCSKLKKYSSEALKRSWQTQQI